MFRPEADWALTALPEDPFGSRPPDRLRPSTSPDAQELAAAAAIPAFVTR
jgi:hypothetical protein